MRLVAEKTIDPTLLRPMVHDLTFGEGSREAKKCSKCGTDIQIFSAELRRGDEGAMTIYMCGTLNCTVWVRG